MPVQLTDEQKKAEAEAQKKADEIKKSEAKKNEPVDFVRRDTRPGVYSCEHLGHKFMIKDRGHFLAKTKAEIKFCHEDPELIVFDSGTPNKKKK